MSFRAPQSARNPDVKTSGFLAVAASLIILANLAADVFYAYLDPRIRYA